MRAKSAATRPSPTTTRKSGERHDGAADGGRRDGRLGRHHARILSQMPGVELVAVADTNAAAAAETAAKCRTRSTPTIANWSRRSRRSSSPCPTSAHHQVAGEFLARRRRRLRRKADRRQRRRGPRNWSHLADATGPLLQVGHVERFNPALVAARPLLAHPRVHSRRAIRPFSFRSTDIGVVHDLMIHDLDLVLDLVAAPVIDVQAFGVAILGEHEDCVQARITFADGAVADLSANRVSPVTSRQMQVWGTDGCVHIDFAAREVVRYSPGPALRFGAQRWNGPGKRAPTSRN